jgi:hypothetical protein
MGTSQKEYAKNTEHIEKGHRDGTHDNISDHLKDKSNTYRKYYIHIP